MPLVTLSESLHSVAEQLAGHAGFGSTEDYIAELVRRDLEHIHQQDPDLFLREALAENGDSSAVPSDHLESRKREIEALLIEGLNSGVVIEVNDAFWQERRRVLQERIAARKNPE